MVVVSSSGITKVYPRRIRCRICGAVNDVSIRGKRLAIGILGYPCQLKCTSVELTIVIVRFWGLTGTARNPSTCQAEFCPSVKSPSIGAAEAVKDSNPALSTSSRHTNNVCFMIPPRICFSASPAGFQRPVRQISAAAIARTAYLCSSLCHSGSTRGESTTAIDITYKILSMYFFVLKHFGALLKNKGHQFYLDNRYLIMHT